MIEFLNSIPALMGGIVSILTAIITILGVYEKRRNKRDATFQNQIRQTVDKALVSVDRTNLEQQDAIQRLNSNTEKINVKLDNVNECICNLEGKVEQVDAKVESLETKVKSIDTQLKYQQEDILDNELSRLQTAIVDYASQLRAGLVPNMTSFEYLFHNYDRYKRMGGNSFIDSEMKFIKEYKEELERKK